MIKNKLLLSLSFALALTGNLVAFEQETKPNSFWQNRKLELKGLKHGIVPSWALNPLLATLPCSAGIAYWNDIITTPQNFAAVLLCAILAPALLHQIFDTPEKIAFRTQKFIDEFAKQTTTIDFTIYPHNKKEIDKLINEWLDTIQKTLGYCQHALECSSTKETMLELNLLVEELEKRRILLTTCLIANQIIPNFFLNEPIVQ